MKNCGDKCTGAFCGRCTYRRPPPELIKKHEYELGKRIALSNIWTPYAISRNVRKYDIVISVQFWYQSKKLHKQFNSFYHQLYVYQFSKVMLKSNVKIVKVISKKSCTRIIKKLHKGNKGWSGSRQGEIVSKCA